MTASPRHVRLFVLICISPLILLFLIPIPQTRWIIRRQIPIQWSLPLPACDWLRSVGIPNLLPPGPQRAAEVLRYEAARHPQEFRLQIAAALDSGAVKRYGARSLPTELLQRFPDEPVVFSENSSTGAEACATGSVFILCGVRSTWPTPLKIKRNL